MLEFFSGHLLISPFSLVLLLIMFLSPDAPFLFIALFFALLHELGHLFAMKIFKIKVESFSIYPFGLDIKAITQGSSYSSEVVCFLAGPAMSLLAGLILAVVFMLFENVYILSAAIVNFLFFILNIMPARGLDGGRALLSFLLSRLDYTVACNIFSAFSTVAFGIICVGAFALIYYTGYNLSLVFICTYLFLSEYVKGKAF